MKKKFLCFLIPFILLVSGCASNDSSNTLKTSANDYPVKINEITINSRPERVVVLSDVLADVVIELGYRDQIIGRSSSCTQQQITYVTDVGDSKQGNLDLESIKSLNAKVVLYEDEITQDQIRTLKDNSILSVKVERAKNRNDLERVYTSVGSLFNGLQTGFEQGKKCAKNILMTLDDITRIVPKQTVPIKACYLLDDQGTTIANPSLESQLIEAAGLMNIVKEVQNNKVEIEKLVLSDPDWILCGVGKKESIVGHASLSSTTAVKNGNVIEIDYNVLCRQGKSIVDTATNIAGQVFPELLNDSPTDEIIADVDVTINEESVSDNKVDDVSNMRITYGDENEKVLKIQNRLDELNYLHIAPNSKFDESMAQAIKDFKFLNGMSVTEDVDSEFLNKLFSDDAISRPDLARQK